MAPGVAEVSFSCWGRCYLTSAPGVGPTGRRAYSASALLGLGQRAGGDQGTDRPQRHRTRGGKLELKTYGYYRIALESTPQRGSIRIYNLTAIRQQVLAPKVFLETLLHEWVHHYDFTGLQLDRSPHTSGFFARIRDLAETLGVGFVAPPKREVSSSATPEDVTVATDRLRPGGVPPPKWIRDQVLALFGHSGRSQG